jgi:hypothetical protein
MTNFRPNPAQLRVRARAGGGGMVERVCWTEYGTDEKVTFIWNIFFFWWFKSWRKKKIYNLGSGLRGSKNMIHWYSLQTVYDRGNICTFTEKVKLTEKEI